MRLDDERESSYVEDRREDNEDRAGGAGFIGGIGNLGRLAVFWPLIRPLLGTKFGWIIIAVGLFIYIGGNPMALLDGTASTNKSVPAQ